MINLVINHDFSMETANIIRLFYGMEEIKITNLEALENNQSLFQADGILMKSSLEFTGKTIVAHASISIEGRENEYNEAFRFEDEVNKQAKSAVKLTTYKLLSNTLDKTFPWGILTGIRPIKIVHDLIDKGFGREFIIKHMKENYLVSDEKAELSFDIALTERKFIYPLDKSKVSVYIGIPFCPTRCHYCSFASNSLKTAGNMVEDYLSALIYEMEQTVEYMNKSSLSVQTIYIGGGTPTSLDEMQLNRLLCKAKELFGREALEFTCEAGRPDTITEGKLKAMKRHGVTRISINPQTMNDDTLERIGRAHTVEETVKSFELARSLGFGNINMDIILGLPGENLQHLEDTLKQIGELKPESLTVHTLAIKRASIIHENLSEAGSTGSLASEMMDKATEFALQHGLKPYYLYRQKHMAENLENVGFCKPGFECIYNIQIIEEKQTNIAFGADAITKVVFTDENRLERQGNIKDIKLYIARIEEQIQKKIQLLDNLYKNS